MEKPLPPRSAAKRAAMLDAAQACFLEKGYASTTIDEVAARAKVSKATIYAHFVSKDELFRAIICRRCDDQAKGLSSLALPDSDDVRVLLGAMAQRLMTLFLTPEVMGIYRMVVAEAPRHPELAKVWYEAGPQRSKQRLCELFDTMRARNLLHFSETAPLVDIFVAMLRGECFNRVLIDLPANPALTVETTIAIVVDTMIAAYGSKRHSTSS